MPPRELPFNRATRRIYSIELTAEYVTEGSARGHPLRDLVTSEPAFVVSSTMRVKAWNHTLEQLTNMAAGHAVGRPCHLVMASISHRRAPACCQEACPLIGGALRGQPAARVGFDLETPSGPLHADMATIGGDGREIMHLTEASAGEIVAARDLRTCFHAALLAERDGEAKHAIDELRRADSYRTNMSVVRSRSIVTPSTNRDACAAGRARSAHLRHSAMLSELVHGLEAGSMRCVQPGVPPG